MSEQSTENAAGSRILRILESHAFESHKLKHPVLIDIEAETQDGKKVIQKGFSPKVNATIKAAIRIGNTLGLTQEDMINAAIEGVTSAEKEIQEETVETNRKASEFQARQKESLERMRESSRKADEALRTHAENVLKIEQRRRNRL